MKKKLAAILLGMMMPAMLFSTNVSAVGGTTVSDNYNVEYKTHVQDYGWETIWKSNGDLSGTVGLSKRLEALRVKLTGADLPAGATITTYVHVQNEGDLGPFAMGNVAGTEGKGQRLERITLNLINLPDHQLRYNVQVQNIGWLRDENDVSTWFVGGEAAGTSGKSYRLEAIKIVLVETNDAYTAYQKALAAVREEDYTSLSWIYYQADVEANAVTEADDKETIQAATEAILAAQKSLVKGSDLSAYNKALASVNEADYTPETWEAYQDVVWSNYVTKDDSQAIVTAAAKKIVEAQKSLQRKINLTRYYELLSAAIESDYLPESWAEYQQVLADNVVTEADSQTAINEAVKKIEEAQKKMVRRLDFTGYQSLLKAVNEADYTVESWAAYQDVVDANVMTENNTQSQIEKAMANIAAAQSNLIKAADLSAYEAALAAVNESDYTPATWLVYQNVVKTNKVTAASGQAAIDAATEKIVAAQLKLVDKADFTAYETALAAVNQNDYTPLSWMAYQKVVTANRASAAAAQDAVDKATDKILAAQLNLVLKGDLTNYKNALAAVKQANYTTESWAEYQKVVKANGMTANSSQSEIDLATENILAAQENLVLKDGNLSSYEKALAKVKEADHTAASWKLYQQLVAANAVNAENTQTEIDAATKNILAAQASLVKKGDLTAYNIALAGLDEADYTAASWKAYQAVVKANVRTAEDLQASIDLSTSKILAAQQALIKVGSMTAYNEALAKVRKENYTTASWNAYQLVVKANIRTSNEAQLVIDNSVQKILAAQKLLVRKYDTAAYNALLAAVKQADYIPASWTTYQAVVKAYPASYSPIQTAIEKIEAAQAKLVKKVDWTAYKKALAAVKEAEYVPATWVAYMEVVNANVVDETNTQTQIDEATKKIIEAQKNLKRKVNLTLYLELLEGVIEYDYSPTSWVIYQKVLADNVVTENNTQTEVDAATEKIRVAQNKLVRRLDYTRYQELVDAMKDKEDQYTSVSWGLYDKVIKDNTLKKDQSETQTQIDKAVANIEAAQKKLVKAGDLTAYNLVLAAVKREDYTTASWDVYLKVLEANEVSKNHSQAEIDVATDKIRLAQLKLAKAATDIAEYNKLIGLLPVEYTSVSWAIYQKVIDANYVLPQDGQTKINAAVVKLREAERKLVKRADDFSEYDKVWEYNLYLGGDPDDPNATKDPLEMKEIDYTTSSWAVYQKVLDANVMDLDKSQTQVNLAVANIKKAQFKLLKGGNLSRYDTLLKYNIVLGNDPDDATDTRAPRPMKETEYTSTSWAIYAKVLSANEMDRDKSQAQIDAAVVKIERAQQKLMEKGDLTGYYAILDKAKKADYTVSSWTIYEKKLTTKGYLVTTDNSQTEINRAIDLITIAQRYLDFKGKTDEYYIVVDRYKDPKGFKTDPWKTYQKALAENVMTSNNTDDEITNAIKAIERAQIILVMPENVASILIKYDEILAKTDPASAYTPTSWADYQLKIKPYLGYTKDTDQTMVDDAYTIIEEAQSHLSRTNQAELDAFEKTLGMYLRNKKSGGVLSKSVESGTGTGAWVNYEAAVEKYAGYYPDFTWMQTVINDNSRPDVIKAATAAIEKTIRKLRPDGVILKLDYVAYDKAVSTAIPWRDDSTLWNKTVAQVAPYYTLNSYDDYVAVCTNNEIVNYIESAPGVFMEQDKINTATSRITSAQESLHFRAEKADIDAYNDEVTKFLTLSSASDNYTQASWDNYVLVRLNSPKNLSDLPNLRKKDCQDATGQLETARLALVPKAATTPVAFTSATADGTTGTTTSTKIDLVFDTAVTGLLATDVTITDGTGTVSKGAISGSGTTYAIALTSVTTQGNVSVAVAKSGYTFTGSPKTVAVYKAATNPDTAAVAADKAALAITYGAGETATTVKTNVTLPTTGANGTTITWAQTTGTAVATNGIVTRPIFSASDAAVALTATITKGASSDTKAFNLTVLKKDFTATAQTVNDNTFTITPDGYALTDFAAGTAIVFGGVPTTSTTWVIDGLTYTLSYNNTTGLASVAVTGTSVAGTGATTKTIDVVKDGKTVTRTLNIPIIAATTAAGSVTVTIN